jgi:hypothetical protein
MDTRNSARPKGRAFACDLGGVNQNPGEKISHESRVTLHRSPSCRDFVNCTGACRAEMLHYYVADGFACAVLETKSHQLRRMCEDGDGQGLAP